MSLSAPSHVSATIGSDQSNSNPLRTSHSMTASRTTPTLCVFVIITGPARNPDSSSQVVPVISPLPLSVNQPPKTGSPPPFVAPRGKIAVTPVRTGPWPTTSFPCPLTIVLCPTVTPATSVIALSGPGMPSNGTPRSRARGRPCPGRRDGRSSASSHRISSRQCVRKQGLPHLGGRLPACLAGLGEGFHHRIAQRAGHVAPQLAEVGWGRVLLHIEHRRGARRGEWRPARKRFEQHDAEGIDVGAPVDVGRAARLLGAHVFLRAHDEAAAGDAVFARVRDRARDPEVDENGSA